MRDGRTFNPKHSLAGLVLAGVVLVGAGAGCAGDNEADAGPVVETTSTVQDLSSNQVRGMDMWVRMPAVGQRVAAAYGAIINDTDTEVTVVAVRSDLGRAELHETIADPQGVMRMRERTEGFVLAPGASVTFEPGGAHVMILDVDMLSLRLAQTVNLEFEIANWGTLEVVAPVRELEGNDHSDHSDHSDHGDHGDHITGEAGDSLDVNALHRLDDDLHAGIFDPVAQRQVVADARATLEVMEVPVGFDRDALIAALDNLDQALVEQDIEAAAEWAFIVHDLAHALEPHHSH
jgi:periplasmic copper chaperone A